MKNKQVASAARQIGKSFSNHVSHIAAHLRAMEEIEHITVFNEKK